MTKLNPIVIIPARLKAQRFPNKPLILIQGEPMVTHVWRRAMESGVGPVVVACCHDSIAQVIQQEGGQAVLTDPDLPSGTDRLYAALKQIDPQAQHQAVINVQGDLPFIPPAYIQQACDLLNDPAVDVGTLVVRCAEKAAASNAHSVKVAFSPDSSGERGRALYFSRSSIPHGAETLYHHIGLYAYRRSALEHFVRGAPTYLEQTESLEQLRALDQGLRIEVAVVPTMPVSIDHPEDLEKL
jgi:3-deoxy-manno-octulosonate cytidylyltransferase (CMP-KDO synthetase)